MNNLNLPIKYAVMPVKGNSRTVFIATRCMLLKEIKEYNQNGYYKFYYEVFFSDSNEKLCVDFIFSTIQEAIAYAEKLNELSINKNKLLSYEL